MPKKYEAIRDNLKSKGTPAPAAKKSAARIFNAQRKPGTPPVTNKKGK